MHWWESLGFLRFFVQQDIFQMRDYLTSDLALSSFRLSSGKKSASCVSKNLATRTYAQLDWAFISVQKWNPNFSLTVCIIYVATYFLPYFSSSKIAHNRTHLVCKLDKFCPFGCTDHMHVFWNNETNQDVSLNTFYLARYLKLSHFN